MHFNELISQFLQSLLQSKILVPTSKFGEYYFLWKGHKLPDLAKLTTKINETDCPPDLTSFLGSKKSNEMIVEELKNILEQFKNTPQEEVIMNPYLQKNNIEVLVGKNGEEVVFNIDTQKEADTTYKQLQKILDQKSINYLKTSNKIKPASFIFDPFGNYGFKDIVLDDIPTKQVNLFTPPPWRLKEFGSSPNPIIQEFLNILFPSKFELSLLLTWIKNAIIGRNGVILVLIGNKGIGKNIFVENLIRQLVGVDYFKNMPKGTFTSSFQDSLDKSRLLFYDEVTANTDSSKKDLKRVSNKLQGVEKKFQDTKQVEVHYSVIIANNDLSDIWIESDDRRFFLPQLNDKLLKISLGQDKINQLLQILNDEEEIGNFGNYILSLPDDPNFDPENAYITKTFYLAVEASLKQTELFIKNYLVNDAKDKYIPLKLIQNEYGMFSDSKRSFITPKSMNNFLNNYLHEGEYRLGELVKYEGVQTVKLSDRLLELKNITTSSNSVDELK